MSLAAYIPQILVVHPSVPVNNIARADRATPRRDPGKLNYASVGIGSPGHIAGELFKLKTGVDIVHVPYKGGGPAVSDTIGGQVQMLFVSMPAAWQHVKSGRLKRDRGGERQTQRHRARRADDCRAGRRLRRQLMVWRAGAGEDAAGDRCPS